MDMQRLFSTALAALTVSGTIALAGCGRPDAKVANSAPAASAQAAAPAAEGTAAKLSLPNLGTAPSWSLRQLDGTVLKSSDLAGKIVVLDFWATWCPPCREEIPGYIDMQRELQDQGVVIVGVSLDRQGPKVVQDFKQKMGINYALVMGDDAIVAAFGGIEAIPTTFLIDRDGKVRDRKTGSMERADYEARVRSLL